MAIIRGGVSANEAEVDAKKQILVVPGVNAIGASGGHYNVGGWTSAVVAAGLAANTPLVTMRMSPTSARKAYVDRIRFQISVSTVGASGAVCGAIALQRFSGATPSGGTARTICRMSESEGTISDVIDVRDSNAALTVTGVTFGNIIAPGLIPLMITSVWVESCLPLPRPIILNPGDGISFRTQTVMPATQTWMFAYTICWEER